MSELIEEGKRLLPSGVRKTGWEMVSRLSGLTEEGSQVDTFRGAGCCEEGLFLLLPMRSTKKMSELTEEGSWDHTLRGARSLDVCSARVMCFKQCRQVSELTGEGSAGPRLPGCWSLRV